MLLLDPLVFFGNLLVVNILKIGRFHFWPHLKNKIKQYWAHIFTIHNAFCQSCKVVNSLDEEYSL